MKKNVLIYSLNYSPETTGVGRYVGQMTEYLCESDNYHVTVLTAPPYYPAWEVYPGYENKYSVVKSKNLKVIRCPIYIPKQPGTLKRILHLVTFALSSFVPLAGLFFRKNTCVLVIAPTLTIAPSALIFGKLKGAKTMLHIQDFELDAMVGLNFRESQNRGFALASLIEKFLLRRFDIVSTISNRMVTSLHNKGVSRQNAVFFPNWVDTSKFFPIEDKKQCRYKVGIKSTGKVVLYSGNIGKKQGLEFVLEVARRLQDNRLISFVIAGNGSEKKSLVEEAKRLELSNLSFMDFVSESDLPYLLNSADVHLVLQKPGVGDSVMPSKLSNIIAVGGHAIVSAEENTEIYDLNAKYPGIFTLIPTDDLTSLEQSIAVLCDSELTSCNVVGKNYADTFLDHTNILKAYEKIMNS